MKPDVVTEGEFKGWLTWGGEAFEHDTAGPFYFKTDEQDVVCLLYTSDAADDS